MVWLVYHLYSTREVIYSYKISSWTFAYIVVIHSVTWSDKVHLSIWELPFSLFSIQYHPVLCNMVSKVQFHSFCSSILFAIYLSAYFSQLLHSSFYAILFLQLMEDLRSPYFFTYPWSHACTNSDMEKTHANGPLSYVVAKNEQSWLVHGNWSSVAFSRPTSDR